MNLSRFISSRFWDTENRRFVSFARYFALISIAIGTLALILSLSVLEGYDKELRSNAVKFTSHIILQNFNRNPINNYPETISKIKTHFPEVVNIAPIIQNEALIKSPDAVEGVLFRGIKQDYNITSLQSDIKGGKFDLTGGGKIIIGRRLANRLKVKLGNNLHIFSLKSGENLSDFSYKAGKFVITGIYESKMAQYDDIICYIGFADAQKITNLQNNQITNFEIMLNDVTLSPKISKQLETYLGYPYFTSTVYEMHRSIFSWIELQKEPIPIILGLIIIIAAFNIVTTLLILVIEKVRSIAVLRALGINRSDIVKIFVKLGISLGLWGSLIGTSITLVFSILQKNFELIRLNGDIYFLDVLPVEIIPMHYVIVIAVSFLLSFIATLIPAIIASRLNPLQAFRFK
jgi:lipoprotein-releasing system permease protein